MPDPNKCFLRYFSKAQPLLRQQRLKLTPQQRRTISKELQRCEKAMLRWAKDENFDVQYVTSITGSIRIR